MSKEIYTKNGEQTYKLVFNETYRLFSSNDSTAFELNFGASKWTFAFHFTNNNNIVQFAITSNVDESTNSIFINLNKWYSMNQIEFIKPLEFKSKDNKIELSVLATSLCTQINKGRTLSISIWQKTKL